MSVAYDPKNFIHEGVYPALGDEHDPAEQRFSDNDVAEQLRHYTAGTEMLPEDTNVLGDERDLLGNDASDIAQLDLDAPPFPSPIQTSIHPDMDAHLHSPTLQVSTPSHVSPARDESPSSTRGRVIPKPNRDVSKQSDGKFHCPFDGCKEDVRSFSRKCEWNKHMDKHERPYRCVAIGCENLPGFTYSGGLLRHEREVHGKHGGPKKTVNCPHKSCKRHTGKGFSRQENLNEHLRRVHTHGGGAGTGSDTPGPTDGIVPTPALEPISPALGELSDETIGAKRKRSTDGIDDDDDYDVRAEIVRTRQENESLRDQLMRHHQNAMVALQQVAQFQTLINKGLREHGLEELAESLERMASAST